MRKVQVLGLILILLTCAVPAFSAEFPLREKYPSVPPISIEELAAGYDSTIIIDVRSQMEFDVAHIAKAQHISIANRDFIAELEKVRSKENPTNIAFYCNGHTCAKSYKATNQAQAAGFENVYAFDAGVFEWISSQPDKGTLLGQTPADPGKLIPKSRLQSKMIGFAEFKAASEQPDTIVIDARDPLQRVKDSKLEQNKAVNLNNIRTIPMDRLVALTRKGEFKNKNLLVFDAVGKQVRWLQYYLEENGYQSYAFLEKGVLGAAAAGGVK